MVETALRLLTSLLLMSVVSMLTSAAPSAVSAPLVALAVTEAFVGWTSNGKSRMPGGANALPMTAALESDTTGVTVTAPAVFETDSITAANTIPGTDCFHHKLPPGDPSLVPRALWWPRNEIMKKAARFTPSQLRG